MPLAFWRLIRVGLVVLGPVLSIYLLMQFAVAPELRSQAQRLLRGSADLVRIGADRFCEKWIAHAESAAQDPAFRSVIAAGASAETLEAGNVEAQSLRDALPDLHRIEILDATGKRWVAVGEPSGFDSQFVILQAKEMVAARQPRVLSRPPSSGERDPNFLFLVPMRNGQNLSIVLSMEVHGAEIRELLLARRDEAGAGAFADLLDEKGVRIVSSFDPVPDWLANGAIDPEIAKRFSSMPPLVSPARSSFLEKANELRESFRETQATQQFRAKNPIEGEFHHVVLERLHIAPWTVIVEVPESALTGTFDRAKLLILLIGIIAAGVAFFAFQPDRRTFDSLRTLRPEIGAITIALLLVGMTFYLRHLVFRLAEDDAQMTGQMLAISSSKKIEEHFRLRGILLHDLSRELMEASDAETAFRQRAEALRRDFGGTLLVRWDRPPKEGTRGVWIEGDRQIEQAKPLPAGSEATEGKNGEARVALFPYPGGSEGAFLALRFDREGRQGWLFWAESISEILRREFAAIPMEGFQITLISHGQRFSLGDNFREQGGLPAQKAKVSLPGEDWQIEVLAGESLMGRRYEILGLVVTILGFVLAGGGAAAAYFGSTNAASLREVSAKDELTDLKNRRAFNEMMEREVSIADRYRRPLALMILDLDHFKRINDTMGHRIGDDVLRAAADVLRGAVRETDVPFRFGGEEFSVILVETSLVSAAGIAERIRSAIESAPISTERGPLKLTVSIGVTEFQAGESIDQFLTRADMALYRAKAEGRNRVVVDRPVGWEA